MENNYLNKKFNITYFQSHNPKNSYIKILSLIWAYLCFPFLLMFNNFGVAHIHGSLKGSFIRKSYFLIWLRLFGTPVIYQCHAAQVDAFFDKQNPKQIKLIQLLFAKYQLRLCLGTQWVNKFYHYTKQPWEVLYNPVPELNIKRLQHATCNFTFMGELTQRKGITDLINGFAQSKNDNSRLLIAGNGDIDMLKSLCSEIGILEKVEFLGWINNEQKLELLAKTDVIVLPSYAEGLPMSILEAMSVGLPVITTPVGAVEDAITHNKHGLLVEPGNIQQISSAISELGCDYAKRARLGENAKLKFTQCFKDDVVANVLATYYSRLIKEGK